MLKLRLTVIITFFINISIYSQNIDNEVLFTVDNESVNVSEFKRVYQKNLDLVKDDSQKDISNYLDLYINFKLKTREAIALGYNEKVAYKRELGNYRKQLVRSYLSDTKVTDALVKEAHYRSINEVNAKHVLVRLDENETDTSEVYKRILNLKSRFKNEGFDSLRQNVHDGKTVFVEDLGYFSAFKMVYPFETAAFNTEVGEISEPFRTQFGYHVVLVEGKRPSRGEVTVAHIMLANNQKDSLVNPKERINSIYEKLQKGETFDALAKQFSDDKSSANKGGLLSPFKGGQLNSVAFEDVAFNLKKDDISKPFQTRYGWHIVKKIDSKSNPTLQEARPELEQKIKRDSRSRLINEALNTKLKERYKISTKDFDESYFVSILDSTYLKRSWEAPENVPEKVLFSIRDKTILYKDFVAQLVNYQRRFRGGETFNNLVSRLYNEFVNAQVRKYHEDNLEEENEEFAQLIGEYRDGLLLFDLMEDKIWNASKKDSVGLQEFFKARRDNYKYNERVDVLIASNANKKELKSIEKLLKSGASYEDIRTKLTKDKNTSILTKDVVEKDYKLLPKDFKFKKGVSKIYKLNDSYHIVRIDTIIPARQKTLEEARGFIATDYQGFMEKEWLKELRDKYQVKVDEAVFNKLKKELLASYED